jgi:hypothetical protein
MTEPVKPEAAAVPKPEDDLKARAEALTREMTGTLQEGVNALTSAAESLAASVKPTPATAAVKSAEQMKAEFDQIAAEKGTGAAFEFYNQQVAGPLAMAIVEQSAAHVAKMQKAVAEKDPELKPLMRRYGKEIAEVAKAKGTAWVAENGYEGLVRDIAGRDPKYQEEREAAIGKKALEEYQAAHPAPGAPGPTQEGVHVGPVVLPSKPATPDADLSAIPVSAEELEVGRTLFGMDKKSIQTQKKEISEWTQKAGGVIGLKKLGGTPICSYADIGLPEPLVVGGE